jgi:hypothetical protein
LSKDSHDQLRFSKRVEIEFGGIKTWIPVAEDVVITKLRWALAGKSREKDADDVRNVLGTQKGKLDLPYIRQWCDHHGTRELFEKLLASVAGLPDVE